MGSLVDFFLWSGVSQCSFQEVGQIPWLRMERASKVSGRASVFAQFLSRVAGSKSGPVAFEVSSEVRSRRVCRVRRSMKLLVVLVGVWFSFVGVSGTEGSVNFVEKVLAKRFAFVVASCTQVPLRCFSGGIERRGGSLFKSCRLIRHHFLELRGSCFSSCFSLFW